MAQVYGAVAVTNSDYEKFGIPRILDFFGKSVQKVVNELYPDTPWLANIAKLQSLYKIDKDTLSLDKSWEDFPLLLEQLGFKNALAAFKSYVFEKETENGPVWVLRSVDWKNFIRGICGKAAHSADVINEFCDKAAKRIDDDSFADFGGEKYGIYLLGHLREFLKFSFKYLPHGYNLIIR